jgi:Asp-tRNA(Asn)/Glu-tRNA(Gln) amidotransferase A subunit family amidase
MTPTRSEPCHLSAVEARRLIGLKQLSPVELMQSCLKRIDAVNPAVNAVVALDRDLAMKQAREAERLIIAGGHLDVLHGLPVGIKDLHPVAGLRSTWGSLLFKNHIPDSDDGIVANIRVAGGIPFCKTNVPEFGLGANSRNRVYGATGNPFDPVLTAAGSSGGTAAALALDMMPLATGSDYGGSSRTPASFCGVAGFRTSPGLIPLAEKMAGLIPWGVNGPMGRSLADTMLLLRAQVSVDRRDPFSSLDGLDWPEAILPADLAQVRAAFTPDFAIAPIDKAIRNVFIERMKTIGAPFLDVVEAAPDCTGGHEIFEVHRGLSSVANHQDKLAKHREMLDRNLIDNVERGLALSVDQIGRAFVEQQAFYKRWHDFFDDYDVLIAPAAAVSPFPHSTLFVEEINGEKMPTYMTWLSLAYLPTMALCCAAVLPCGRDDKGLPFGIQVIGPRGHDQRVLSIALALESVLAADPDTARPIPPTPAPTHARATKPATRPAKKGAR